MLVAIHWFFRSWDWQALFGGLIMHIKIKCKVCDVINSVA